MTDVTASCEMHFDFIVFFGFCIYYYMFEKASSNFNKLCVMAEI